MYAISSFSLQIRAEINYYTEQSSTIIIIGCSVCHHRQLNWSTKVLLLIIGSLTVLLSSVCHHRQLNWSTTVLFVIIGSLTVLLNSVCHHRELNWSISILFVIIGSLTGLPQCYLSSYSALNIWSISALFGIT